MPRLRSALLVSLLLLSACGMTSDCDYFGNCRCNDWYDTCSGHG